MDISMDLSMDIHIHGKPGLQLLGFAPRPPLGPLDPAGGLLSPVPLFGPPPKQISGYAPDLTKS